MRTATAEPSKMVNLSPRSTRWEGEAPAEPRAIIRVDLWKVAGKPLQLGHVIRQRRLGRSLALPPRLTFVCLLLTLLCSPLHAQAPDVAALEEQAMKQAVAALAPSLVKIETVGGLDRVGEVLTGTGPTTGVVIAADGYIISSAFNFASKPAAILCTLADGRRLQATVVATDKLKMLTLLKVEATDLLIPQAAPADTFRVGQWSIALGKTFDDEQPSMSVGIVSATKRIWGKALQTDAKISPVNYGGPLVDMEGRVLGILVPLSPQATGEVTGVEWYDSGIGFAIPYVEILASLERLKQGKDLFPGLMGVTIKGKNIYEGAPVIDRVRYGSPALQAGLKEGDTLLEMDGQKVVRQAQVMHVLGNKYAGDKVSVVVKRDEETVRGDMTLIDKLEAYESAYLGILPVRDPISQAATPGVGVRHAFPDSPAATAGLDRGYRILKFGDTDLTSSTQLLDLVSRKRPKDKVTLTVNSGVEQRTVEVTLGSIPEKLPTDFTSSPIVPKDNGMAPPEAPKVGRISDKMPAHEHDYWAYVPEDYNPDFRYGLMVFLHPGGDNMEGTMLKHWTRVSDERGLILLGPKSKELGGWNPNEADFVKDLTEEFQKRYSIDKARTLVQGYDAGGIFALHLAFKHRALFHGVVAVAAPLREQPPDNEPDFRQQFLFISGDADPLHRPVTASAEFMRKQKFPVIHSVSKDGEHRYPIEDADSIGLWCDALDRI